MSQEVALVTGASRGIGKAIALELAKSGYKVAVNYNSSSVAAEDIVSEIIKNGGNACAVKANVSSLEQVKDMFKEVSEKLGNVDVLVCNAGITKDNLLMRMKEEEWDSVISSDLSSFYYCTKEAIRPMVKAKKGRIIAISSVIGLIGNPGQCNYAAAKAGMIGFVKSLAKEVASRGITVNAIAPGYIDTDMTSTLSEEVRNEIMRSIPVGRIGKPEDIAKAVLFLASDSASYIQGQVLAVDGGMTM
ncbi:MAG: 3-oxoacyl-[acyl-carrier-protein] reductase [Synergistaceae bacterium]